MGNVETKQTLKLRIKARQMLSPALNSCVALSGSESLLLEINDGIPELGQQLIRFKLK